MYVIILVVMFDWLVYFVFVWSVGDGLLVLLFLCDVWLEILGVVFGIWGNCVWRGIGMNGVEFWYVKNFIL